MKSPSNLLVLLFALLACCLVLASIIWREYMMGRDAYAWRRTQSQMGIFILMCSNIDAQPGTAELKSDLAASLEQMRQVGYEVDNSLPMMVKNQDGWGNHFIYRWDKEHRVVTIQSFGSNGRDDQGKGDDLIMSRDFP